MKTDTSDDWRACAKTGDACMIIGTNGRASRHTVERTTKTQIVVDGTKYRRADGREVGTLESYFWAGVEPVCEETLAAAAKAKRRTQAVSKLRDVSWRSQSDETLAAVIAVLDAR